MKAKRYNKGKIRHELIPVEFTEALAKIFTMGAEKYTDYDEEGKVIYDGSNNWRGGLNWKGVIASVKRHIAKWENGEDYDYDFPPEIIERYGPSLHLANAAWGLSILTNYYKTHPELDDRHHWYLNVPKIGLDIDEVLCNWVKGWTEYYQLEVPKSWFFDRDILERFAKMKEKGTLDDFYLNLDPLTLPDDIPFEPHCYVTSRPVDTRITEKWLEKHGYPARPVITVPTGESKVEVLKRAGCEVFIDDRFENFVELNKAGITCYLWDAPHNQRYDVGYKRIKSLWQLPFVKGVKKS